MKKFLSVILAIVIVFGANSAFVSAAPGENQSTQNATGDVKDDRPDDAVGGDNSTAVTSISDEARAWAVANGFDLAAFEKYTAPSPHAPSSADITAFKNWMKGGSNPRNQVMKQATEKAGEKIANELWNYCNTIWKNWMNTANVGSSVSRASGLKNVGAMQEGMFAGYFGALLQESSEYANAKLLIDSGFVVSSDGTTYRLHNIKDGSIVYEIAAPKTETVSDDQLPEGLLEFTKYFPKDPQKVTEKAIALLIEYAKQGEIKEPENVDKNIYNAAAEYVNNTFGDYFGQCPGPTVVKGISALGISLDAATEDKVGSSVGEREFVASYFGSDNATAKLWKLGFLPSFDGETYRLHSGKDGTVVYEINKDNIPEAGGNLLVTLAAVGVVVILGAGVLVFIRRKKKTN